MRFESTLIEGRLIRRYKRFLADVELANGEQVTAHTPNTGSMLGCAEPGSRVWLLDSGNPKRKYRLSWEMVESTSGVRVGINTLRANRLVEEAIRAGLIPELSGFSGIRREVKFGASSRVDLVLEGDCDCYVEVKNVTAAVDGTTAFFPDAVSERASKHVRELISMLQSGQRAAMIYCVQREDVREVRPADHIDPTYGQWLRQGADSGLELYALGAVLNDASIELSRNIPVVLP
ncbi:MAG: DNA/RNA nuclease SfsA [Gammaproteobacteria bacterium]